MQSDHPLAFLFPGLQIVDLYAQAGLVTLTGRATQTTAYCPHCRAESARVHSYYTRHPRDLPLIGSTVRLVLHVRRWRCLNPGCITKTFSDPLPDLIAPAAQRT